jgi:RNA polymerase sigma factor (sigma-70 family)
VIDADLESLMRAAQGGDRDAYAQLLKRLVPLIERMAVAKYGSALDTDDVVQDVLLSLHSVRRTYDPRRPFMPWLASIVRNRLIDAYRRKARIARIETPVAQIPETVDGAEPILQEQRTGDPELLRRAIADLPAGQRRAVELLKLEELSLKEASAVSGLSIAALKVAVHRGLKALRGRLASRG